MNFRRVRMWAFVALVVIIGVPTYIIGAAVLLPWLLFVSVVDAWDEAAKGYRWACKKRRAET